MTASIASLISVRRRYVRSVAIARDLDDPEALEGYVVTPSARDAAIRIMQGLDVNSRQRAFRIVGPYGCGKSAFGLFLARLFREQGEGAATRLLAHAHGDLPRIPQWHPIVLEGRRVGFATELLRAVTSASASLHMSRRLLDRARAMLACQGQRDAHAVTELIADVASALRARTGAGLLVIIDEMGRFLEHTAVYPLHEDPAVFQALAERSSGGAGADLAVVGILHHGFGEYFAGLGAWIEAEWSRVATRYEEIRFDSSTEQALFMIARAFEQPHCQPHAVRRRAEHHFAEAVDRGVFAAKHEDVVSIAHCLYPLHPAAVATLAAAIRRFGQNERSLFSFLQSLEPYGFQHYARSTPYDGANWYRTSNVFDHLAATSGEFTGSDRGRRWSRALDALRAAAGLPSLYLDVLKTVALSSVLEPVPGILADELTIAWCLDREPDDVSTALDSLASRGLIYRRTHRSDYSLWSNSTVDLSRWLDTANARVQPPRRFEDVTAFPRTARPLVAHRHYHRTGTLRTFDVRLWTQEYTELRNGDGLVLVAPVYPGEDRETVLRDVSSYVRDAPLALICLRIVPPNALNLAHELAIWDWIQTHCPDLRVDELARTEVSERVASAEAALSRATSLLAPSRTAPDDIWWVAGEAIDFKNDRLSSLLSDLCDEVYHQSPIVRNETLNRSTLSSAGATARMRLLDAMLSNATKDRLAIQGTPPELTMYLSLFRESGIHRADEHGTFGFRPPTDSRWKPIWTIIARLVSSGDRVSFDSLMHELAQPPFGLRPGPSLPIIAAFVLGSKDEVAVLERGTFLPELTVSHFMRLAKAPRNFSIQSLSEPENQQGVLCRLATRVRVVGACRPAIADIAEKLYKWFNLLSPYALQTADVSPVAVAVRQQLRKASEPGRLFFRQLPAACCPLHEDKPSASLAPDAFVSTLDDALKQLDQATSRLRSRAIAVVVRAFSAEDLDTLRNTLRREFAPHKAHLQDHRLEVFMDRATVVDVSEDIWLDGVAGHLVGKRPANWTDRTIDRFDLEVRVIAGNLTRWLAMAQTAQGSAVGLRSVHVVDIDGHDRMVVLKRQPPDRKVEAIMDAVRGVLDKDSSAPEVLGRLLEEYLDRAAAEEDNQ